MQESQFGFSYDWNDLRPIRLTVIFVICGQCIGALAGVIVDVAQTAFLSAWIGAACLTFPAYLLGLAFQVKTDGDAIKNNRRMVLRCGAISLLLFLAAIGIMLNMPRSTLYNGNNARFESLAREMKKIKGKAGLPEEGRCEYQDGIYRCRVPENARDALRAALNESKWLPTPITSPALFSFENEKITARFVCPWNAGHCELWLAD